MTESGLLADLADPALQLAVFLDHPLRFTPMDAETRHLVSKAYAVEGNVWWVHPKPLHIPNHAATDPSREPGLRSWLFGASRAPGLDGPSASAAETGRLASGERDVLSSSRLRGADATLGWPSWAEAERVEALVEALPEFRVGQLAWTRSAELQTRLWRAEGWAVARIPYFAWRLAFQPAFEALEESGGEEGERAKMGARGVAPAAAAELLGFGASNFLAAVLRRALDRREVQERGKLTSRDA